MFKQLAVIGAVLTSTATLAADLPSGKAAPATQYVKICDAYGSGFFYIPGTDTCLRVGGLVRYDTFYAPAKDVYKVTSGARAIATPANTENTYGQEIRGRVDLDARTATELGTLRTIVSTRLGRTSGILAETAAPSSATQSATTTSPTLENAYVQFAGFTAGLARDNFQFMPPNIFSGEQHWASFAIGAKQFAYTQILGGGLSATVAVQDPSDTAVAPVGITALSTVYSPNKLPQYNGRIDYDQSWGGASVMGAYRQLSAVDPTGVAYDKSANVWALGAGVKVNLPFIAAGDVIYFTGAYADGMTEYTTSWGSNKIGAGPRRANSGWVINQPSIVYFNDGINQVKSWSVGTMMTHYWAPTWRSNFFGSYGSIKAPDQSAALVWDGKSGFGDAKMWSAGTNLIWSPAKDLDIGLETAYQSMKQDVRYTLASSTNLVGKESDNNWTARFRVERKF